MSEIHPEHIPPHSIPGSEGAARLRSVPYRRPYVWAQIFALINYCGAVALLTAITMFFLFPNPMSVRVVVFSVVFFVVSSIVSFFRRRHVICPLCKGAPLLNSRAHVHHRATRIFPLDYGTSAMLLLIFTQTFRCMYCGAKFDLLKPKPDLKKEIH